MGRTEGMELMHGALRKRQYVMGFLVGAWACVRFVRCCFAFDMCLLREG